MKVLCTEQRTPEWFAARRGCITASSASLVLAGRHTKGRRLYVAKLADDVQGLPDFDDHDVKPWFEAGVFYESWARGWYSFTHETDVEETGFVVHDEFPWLGCSPDGLVGEDGCVEIKYRQMLRTYMQHTVSGLRPSSWPQVQLQMFVMQRDWCDYVNYWRSVDHDLEKGHVQRIYRDDAYIDNTLLPACVQFWDDVAAEVKQRRLQRKVSDW